MTSSTKALDSAHLVRDIQVLVQEHLELTDADVQIAVGELVGDVEAQWAELTSLQDDPVEETQRQEQRFEVRHLKSGAVTQEMKKKYHTYKKLNKTGLTK